MADISLSIQPVRVNLVHDSSVPTLVFQRLGDQGPQGEVEGTAISELLEAVSVQNDDLLVIVSSGVTKKITALTLKTYFNS